MNTARRWWVLALLFSAMAVSLLDRQVLSVVAPVLRETLVRSAGAALGLVSVASLGINAIAANLMGLGDSPTSMVMMLLTGLVADRFSYTPVFVCAGAFPLITLLSLLVLVGRVPPEPRLPAMVPS